MKRIRSARNANRVRNTAILAKLAFEEGYLLAKNEIAPLDDSGDCPFDLLGDRLTLCLEIHQRYRGTKI